MKQTPSQTVGPFFAYGLAPEQYCYDFKSLVDGKMVDGLKNSDTIIIIGQVLDGNGDLIPDAMIELWDADNQLFGRFGTGTDKENRFIFQTIKPTSRNGQAPYLSVIIFMRGQLIHTYTRIYFSDESELNKQDEVLNSIEGSRRNTIIAQNKGSYYEFNIKMQGEGETVFFEL